MKGDRYFDYLHVQEDHLGKDLSVDLKISLERTSYQNCRLYSLNIGLMLVTWRREVSGKIFTVLLRIIRYPWTSAIRPGSK